jgi:hypothetical protein
MSNQQQQQQEEENILLPTPTVPNHRNARLVRLWNSLIGQTSYEISIILQRMNRRRLFNFLEFMHNICLHDPSIQYSQERLEHFQTIMMCCPRLIITRYLLSIDEQCRVNLLEHCDVIWTIYFVGLIELGHDIEVYIELHDLMTIHGNDFAFSLVLFLVREISNQELPLQLRERIYQFVCRNPLMVLHIVLRENEEEAESIEELIDQINQWSLNISRRNRFNHLRQWTIGDFRFDQEHQAVNAQAFVCRTFPLLHPLAPGRVYQCGICKSGPDERNDDGTMRVFRSMNCCPQQMCCHDCLVNQATTCNTPDSEFKNTGVFVCPFARHKTNFFTRNP